MEIKSSDVAWYAIRITYGRELTFKQYLDNQNVDNFVPMHYRVVAKENKKERKLVPVVHNLIFVHTNRKLIDSIKKVDEYRFPIRYIIDCANQRPVVVPEKQMKHFITVASSLHDQVVFLEPDELNMKQGDRVRITNGIWTGVEGVFVRVRGDRRIVVSLHGIMAVATAFVHPSCLEKIN